MLGNLIGMSAFDPESGIFIPLMPELFNRIRVAVAPDRVTIGDHADDRLRERRIPVWQVLAGLDEGKLLRERPNAKPNPAIEVEQVLADGASIKVMWSWLGYNQTAKLVTVHFFDR